MFARISQFHEHTDNLDNAVRVGEEQLVPQLKAEPGYLGAQFLIDRETGHSMSITYWENRDALRASEEKANRIRRESNTLTGSETTKVERYEVALRVGL